MRVLLTMSHNNIVLNIIPTLHEGYIVSVHRMVMEIVPLTLAASRGVTDTSIVHKDKTQNTRERFFVKLSINNHIVGLVHKNHTIIEI